VFLNVSQIDLIGPLPAHSSVELPLDERPPLALKLVYPSAQSYAPWVQAGRLFSSLFPLTFHFPPPSPPLCGLTLAPFCYPSCFFSTLFPKLVPRCRSPIRRPLLPGKRWDIIFISSPHQIPNRLILTVSLGPSRCIKVPLKRSSFFAMGKALSEWRYGRRPPWPHIVSDRRVVFFFTSVTYPDNGLLTPLPSSAVPWTSISSSLSAIRPGSYPPFPPTITLPSFSGLSAQYSFRPRSSLLLALPDLRAISLLRIRARSVFSNLKDK